MRGPMAVRKKHTLLTSVIIAVVVVVTAVADGQGFAAAHGRRVAETHRRPSPRARCLAARRRHASRRRSRRSVQRRRPIRCPAANRRPKRSLAPPSDHSGAATLTANPLPSAVGQVAIARAGGPSTPVPTPVPTPAPVPSPTPVPIPAPPTNAAPPTISGAATLGRILSSTSGIWSGAPTSYKYQWQGCDASGANCADIGGAAAVTYTVASSDIGHTIRVVVIASNAGGNTSQASSYTAQVGPSVACSETLTTASNAAAALADAAAGSVVCLSAGSYGSLTLNGVNPGGYVTVEPAPGATVTVDGIQVANSSFLRFQGLQMTAGFNMYDTGSTPSHDYQFIDNNIGNTEYGIVIDGKTMPISNVLIQGNYIHNLDFPGTSCTTPGPGYAGGQGITIYNGDGITVSHNTLRSISWHYIQGGGTALGMTVDHNLFEGPIPSDRLGCTHLNVWQIWNGGSNNTFSNNVVRGAPGSPAAVTPILFETGPGGGTCGDSMSNTTITNNLFYDDSTAYSIQVLTTTGMTITDNTVIGSEYGTWLGRSDTCGAGSGYNVSDNLVVQNKGGGQNISMGACVGACIFDYNVTQDGSANANGSTHYVINWAPNFVETIDYRPIGLPFAAGYQGGGGP
jgi:hypothetical protein